ncbi:hypothetical protein Tco_1033213 [Tanacetum coccineum]|uniref:SMP domain-containing protein n=1 Tax=Tanacetum coccineum TaxID=301880 RepID=A0ABQ5GGB3_9ASTR
MATWEWSGCVCSLSAHMSILENDVRGGVSCHDGPIASVPQTPQLRSSPVNAAPSDDKDGSGTSEEKPADTLGDAGRKVQQEIGKEFTAMVASGTVHVTEAAALATKKMVQKYDT